SVHVTSTRSVGPVCCQERAVAPFDSDAFSAPQLIQPMRSLNLPSPAVAKIGEPATLPESPTAECAGVVETATMPAVTSESAASAAHDFRRPPTIYPPVLAPGLRTRPVFRGVHRRQDRGLNGHGSAPRY